MSDEILLFDLPQQPLLKSVAVSDHLHKTEEPWLRPIWRDSEGKYHYARFELVYRYFSTHKIHEVVFNYVGQHEVGGFPGDDRDSGHRIRDELERFLRDGWPQPAPGRKNACEPDPERKSDLRYHDLLRRSVSL